MKAKSKKVIGTAARFAICAAALWFVLASVSLSDHVTLVDGPTLSGTITDFGDRISVSTASGELVSVSRDQIETDGQGAEALSYGLFSAWRNSSKILLLVAVGIFFAVPLLQAIRFSLMLRAQNIELRLWPSIKLAFAGNFLNFAAPLGSTAGDVFKAYYISLHTDRKTEAATTVFIDRAIGLGSLLLTVGIIAIFATAESKLAPLRSYLIVLLFGGLVAFGVYVSPLLRSNGLSRAILARLPWGCQLARIDATGRALVARKGILLGSIGITLILQIFAAAAFICVCLALGMGVFGGNVVDVYAYFSTGEVIKAIPGPPQGLGTMELAYSYFFGGLGSASQIVSAAFAIRLVNLVCALPGLAITATGAYRPNLVHDTSFAEVESSRAALTAA